MKKKIKRVLTNIFHPVARKLGYSQKTDNNNEVGKNSLIPNFCKSIKRTGFLPMHIVDVGANRGGWTRFLLNYFPDAYYSLFEPQYWLENYMLDLLNNNKIILNKVGVSNNSGTSKFTILDMDHSCSFKYTEKEALEFGYKQIDIPVVSLNDHFKNNDRPIPDIIKIDAEGMDLEVLEGASDFFGKTEIFLVEAAVVNKIYKNSCLEVIKYMDSKGYTLFDITDLNRNYGNILWLVEMVFINKKGIINSFNFEHEH